MYKIGTLLRNSLNGRYVVVVDKYWGGSVYPDEYTLMCDMGDGKVAVAKVDGVTIEQYEKLGRMSKADAADLQWHYENRVSLRREADKAEYVFRNVASEKLSVAVNSVKEKEIKGL